LTEKVGFALRAEKKRAGCVMVKIRYPDFETTTHQSRIFHTDADGDIIPVVKTLFNRSHVAGRPVRLLGVRLSEFAEPVVQGNLFDPVDKKKELYAAIDEVKSRFGRLKIKRASSG
jgi:DNA polymerase-4